GNKLVVQARLKGAGMHWARQHVNPMLALRNVVCNDRWEEAWREITLVLRHKPQRTAHPATPPDIHQRSPPLIPLLPAAPAEPRRPAPNHPWRCTPIGRARRIDPKYPPLAKS
ncbi:MAG: hypothetical protein EXR62_15925, partial [Chloroflexi bacterium]|nr:hypothetical protein [Chloroflexota bacterium]